jgi:hypothetical protein
MQKKYGMTPQELEALTEGMIWVLSEYTIEEIINSIREYVKHNDDMPAPANLRKLIEEQRARDCAPLRPRYYIAPPEHKPSADEFKTVSEGLASLVSELKSKSMASQSPLDSPPSRLNEAKATHVADTLTKAAGEPLK